MKTILKVMLAAGAAGSLLAQNQPGQQIQLRELVDKLSARRTVEFVSGDLISNQVVKGAPFSAEAVTETTQTLADGNRIVQRTSSKQYRDTEGRERKEETSSMGAIFITDPVAGVNYTLHPESKTAEKGPVPLPGGFIYFNTNGTGGQLFRKQGPTPIAGGYGGGVGYGRGIVIQPGPPATIDLPGGIFIPDGNSGKVEQLSATQIEGVLAQGTRTTTTIPAGQIGNDRPINVVYERWYSPDLQLTVMTKHSDPRSGETVYKLTNIVRVEQSRALFEVPTDYTVANGALRFKFNLGKTF
jgi:hypothetical protein